MRLLWVDIAKITAVFGVILLHVSAPFLIPFSESTKWWVGNAYDSFSRWCVPLFVMISGAIILPKAGKTSLRKFLLVRVRRILIPFFIWSGIYFVYRIEFKGEELSSYDFFPMLLTEPVYYHLWFIYMLIVLYLFAPVISKFLNEAPKKHIWYLITLWFLWASILPFIDNPLNFDTHFTPDMDDYSALRLSGYFLLGYMLRKTRAESGLHLSIIIFIFLTGGLATILGTYWMSREAGSFYPFFYKYFSITVIAMTVSLFLLIKSILSGNGGDKKDKRKGGPIKSPKVIQRIGMSVFGIYLAHALVLEVLRDGYLGFVIDHTSFLSLQLHPALGLPLFALSIFTFSLVPMVIIRFIPIVRETLT